MWLEIGLGVLLLFIYLYYYVTKQFNFFKVGLHQISGKIYEYIKYTRKQIYRKSHWRPLRAIAPSLSIYTFMSLFNSNFLHMYCKKGLKIVRIPWLAIASYAGYSANETGYLANKPDIWQMNRMSSKWNGYLANELDIWQMNRISSKLTGYLANEPDI